jgi:hypothetical protein
VGKRENKRITHSIAMSPLNYPGHLSKGHISFRSLPAKDVIVKRSVNHLAIDTCKALSYEWFLSKRFSKPQNQK